MGIWIRVDANLDHHPKAKRAGRWGKTVAQLVWRLIKRHGRDGVIGASYVTGDNLADEDGAHESGDPTPDMYSRGLQRAIEAVFFKVLPDGQIEAVDWDDYQWDRTSAERQQRLRDKRKRNGTSRNGPVTERNVTGDTAVTLGASEGPKVTPPSPTPPPPDPDGTDHTTSCAPIGAQPLSPVEEVADRRALGQRLQADYVSEIAALIEACYAREHGMASDAGNGIRREVAGHLINIAKRDGFAESRRANKAEVVRIAEAYFRDQDPFVADAKHPWKMLLSERVTRYRRPLAKKPQPEAKANG